MSAPPPLVQSIRQRLTNIARQSGEDVQRVLVRYAIERLLFRMSVSRYKDLFVVKGATLFSLWTAAPYRSTGDLDLLGRGPNDAEALKAMFAEIGALQTDPPDALVYETASMSADTLRADTKYAGVSLRFDALLGRAKLPIMIDIGFGDSVNPAPEETEFPSLLDLPAARLKAYPPQTVVAEKLEAMCALGLANTRVKDIYDLWAISQAFDFSASDLATAIKATFTRRGTAFPSGPPPMLTPAYAGDPSRQQMWRAFLVGRGAAAAPDDLAAVAEEVAAFAVPALQQAATGSEAGQWQASRRAWLNGAN